MLKDKINNIIHILRKKEIHVRDIFLLFLIVTSLSFWIIYTSFAIFTDTITKNNVASLILEVPTYTITSSSELFNSQTKQITVPANESLRFDLTISSTSSGNTKYKVYYEMVSPTSLPDTLTVGVNSFSDNPKTDIIALNNTETKNVDIEILNSGKDSVTLKFDVLGGYPNNEVVLPENKFELIEFSPTTEITKTSNTNEISLKDSSVGNLTDYKIYGDSRQSNLPDGYQEVEYIESTGTQYIDIGFVPNNNTITKIKFSQSIDGGNGAIFGARITNNNEYRVQVSMSSDKTEKTIQRVFGNQINGFTSDYYNWSKDTVYEMEFGKSVYINDILIDTFTDVSFTAHKNLYLFGFNGNDVLTTPTSSKVYYFKIYDDGILIRNMIPCYKKLDNTIGMYDTVNGKFYTNAGTGTFLKGNDVVPTPDNPIDVVNLGENSKNLFDVDNLEYGAFSQTDGLPISGIVEQKRCKYKIYCTEGDNFIQSNSNNWNMRAFWYASDDTFISSSQLLPNVSIIAPANTTYMKFNTGASGVATEQQLERGSQATEYKPYRYIDVVSKGKNLFDPNSTSINNNGIIKNGALQEDGSYRIKPTILHIFSDNTTLPLEITSQEKVTISLKAKMYSTGTEDYYRIGFRYTDGTYSYSNSKTNTDYEIITLTSLEGKTIQGIGFDYKGGGSTVWTDILYLQAEYGTTATSYETHQTPSTTTIDLTGHDPLRKIGDVADYIDYKNGKIVRNVGKYQFAGDEGFSQSDSMSTDTSVAYYTSSVVPAPKINGTTGYMNIGYTIGMSKQKSYSNCFIYNSNSSHFLRITKNNIPNWSDDLTSVEKLNLFKAYLAQQHSAGTPVTIYYELNTPDDSETINLPQIPTFEGTNIFKILNGSLSLSYNKST